MHNNNVEETTPAWLIVHLCALTVAYGSVLAVDFIGFLWLVGRMNREYMLRITNWAQPVIWTGLITMMVSGAMLGPDLSKPLTRIKMILVILLALNGLNLDMLRKRTIGLSGQTFWGAPNSYKAWSVFSIGLSQALWLSIIAVAAMNSR